MIEQSPELNELGTALAKAQTQIKSALKDSVNSHFKNRYADLTAIVEASRDALTANGIAVLQLPMLDPDLGRVIVSTMLLHSSGQWIRSAAAANPKDLSPQSIGSAITYLRRYGLSAMVGVVSEEDDDANTAQPTQSKQQPQSNGSRGSHDSGQAKTTAELATPKQLGMIRAICQEISREPEAAADYYYHCKLDELSKKAASELIEKLNELKAKL